MQRADRRITAERKKTMSYNILFTSLYEAGKGTPLRYYCVKEGEECKYTDAALTAEATTKYLLSSVHIDQIYVLGTFLSSQAEDNEKLSDISGGQAFYNTDLTTLSAENIFRYRLSQFRDDLFLDLEYEDDGISQEEQEHIEEFIRKFYEEHSDSKSETFNRFFERISMDPLLYETLKKEMTEMFPEARGKEAAYLDRVRKYLYLQLRDFSKLSILKGNENAKIRFLSAIDENRNLPVKDMMHLAKQFLTNGTENVNIYMAMNNDDMDENLVMLGVLNILDLLYGEEIEIKQVYTPTEAFSHLSGMVQESTDSYGLTSTIAAVKSFLRYGKADMIVECWENSGSKNRQIEKMVYAMKRIDNGLSLCYIQDIVKGISTLRELFRNGVEISENDPVSGLFLLMSEGIKNDYGKLVSSDDAGFIDLIRWAYQKGFYQACLTLIEAKAPADFISRGMFYYCNDESQKDHVAEFFGRRRLQMKPYEYWKMNDIDHYFIKNYFIYKVPNNTLEHQRENAKALVSCIDNTNPDILTGYTVCDDRKLLEDLMTAYLRVGTIRNSTNHAEETSEEETLFTDDKEESTRVRDITECIQYFIQSFDRVSENIGDKNPVVVKLSSFDVKRAASRLEEKERTEKRNQR